MRDIVRPIVNLTIVCLVLALALAGANALTADSIKQTQIRISTEARRELLPEADDFDLVDLSTIEAPEGVTEIAKAKNGAGVIVKTSTKGYGGEVVMMTAFGSDGNVVACKVLSDEETPGLGKRIENASFLDQYKGQAGPFELGKNVQKLAGASISSRAATTSVNAAVEAYNLVKEG